MSQASAKASNDGGGTQFISLGDTLSGQGSKNSTWLIVGAVLAILAVVWLLNRRGK